MSPPASSPVRPNHPPPPIQPQPLSYRQFRTTFTPAATKIQEALALDPSSAEYRIAYVRALDREINASLGRAERALIELRYGDAEAAYRRVLALQPSNDRALAGLRLIETARRHDTLYQEAEAAWAKRDVDGAQGRLRAILAANGKHERALALQRLIEENTAQMAKASALSAAFRKPITIEFRDTPLKMVFEVISRTAGLNFVFDKDVRTDQKTTIFLRNSTIEAAVNVLLLTNQLEQRVLDGNSILIYPNTPAKQKDYQALMVKTFYLANSDAKTVGATLKTILKTKDIVVDEKLNLVMIRDSLEAIRLADKLVALQDVPEPEVMLEVEILEVKRSRLQALGINWPDAIALRPLPLDGLTVKDLRNLNSSTIGATVGPTTIRANQTDADVNLLANPRIRARNREKAKILIGDRVPNITSTITATGFSSESVTYIDVGLKLDVEPTIYLDNEVAIKVTLEVSNIVDKITTKTGTVAYQIGTRTATSVLRLKDGENQLLAGLISDEDRRNASKLPFLGDIPLLGRLFGSHSDEGIKTEIVLSITPRILRNLRRAELYLAEFDGGTETSFRGRPEGGGAGPVAAGLGGRGAAAPAAAAAPGTAPAQPPAGRTTRPRRHRRRSARRRARRSIDSSCRQPAPRRATRCFRQTPRSAPLDHCFPRDEAVAGLAPLAALVFSERFPGAAQRFRHRLRCRCPGRIARVVADGEQDSVRFQAAVIDPCRAQDAGHDLFGDGRWVDAMAGSQMPLERTEHRGMKGGRVVRREPAFGLGKPVCDGRSWCCRGDRRWLAGVP
jgi:general secretion pathway protein D